MRKSLLHVSISAAVLGLLLWRARVWDLGDVFAGFNPWAAVLVVLLNLGVLGILTWRSWLVFRRLYGKVSPAALFPISAVGNLVGALTPANLGDLWRAYIYKRRFAVPVSHGAAMIVYERAMSFYLTALGAAIIALYRFLLADFSLLPLPGLILMWIVFGLAPYFGHGPVNRLAARLTGQVSLPPLVNRGPLLSLQTAARQGGSGLNLLFESRALACGFLATTSVYLLISTLQLWLIADALGLGLALHDIWFILAIAAIAGAASSLPFGLGVTDGAIVLLLGSYGVAVGPATTVAILLRGLQTLPLGLVAIASYIFVSSGETRTQEAPQNLKALPSLNE